MPELTCPLKLLIGDSPIPSEGIEWRIAAHPPVTIGAASVTIGTLPRGGTIATGIAYGSSFTVRLGHTSDDAVYNLELAERATLPFQYRATDPADWTLRDHADAYRQRHPNGLQTEYVPTPGPEGPRGLPGLPGIGAVGPEGPLGPEGSSYHFIFQAAAEGAAPDTPVGGTVDTDTGTVTPPAGWSNDVSEPGTGMALYESFTVVHHTHTGIVIPVWHGVTTASGIGRPGAVGPRGAKGDRAWTPIYQTIEVDEDTIVLRLGAWVHGQGEAPGGVGEYLSDTGLTSVLADATNFKGRQGDPGPRGLPGPGGGGGGLTYEAIQDLPRHQPGRTDQIPFARVAEAHEDVAAAEVQSLAAPIRDILDEQDRILPQGAADHQTVVWDPVTSAWIPSHLYDPSDFIEHVSEFPDHRLAASPDLVYLDGDISAGQAQDGTLIVGFGLSSEFQQHPLAGYDVFEHTGALHPEAVSVYSILGSASATEDFNGRNSLVAGGTFSLQYVRFSSQAAADKWSHFRVEGVEYTLLPTIRQGSLYYRNIQGYPDALGYAAGQVLGDVIMLDWNLRTESGVYLLQGPGSIQLSPRGIYEKLSSAYSRLASTGYHYTHGTGAPVGKPRHPDEWFRNEFGDLYVAAGFPRLRDEIVNSAGTLLAFDGNTDDYSHTAVYSRNPVSDWATGSPDGAFRWSYWFYTTGDLLFNQKRDGSQYPEQLTWAQVTAYLADSADNAAYTRLRDHSRVLGIYTAHADAFDFLDEQITQQEFDSGETDYYYFLTTQDTTVGADPKGGVYKVTAFSASHLVYDDSDLHWQGPLFDRDRLTTWIHNNTDTLATEFKLGGYQVLPLPDQPDPDDASDTSDDAGKSPVVQDDGTTAWETPSGGGGGGETVLFEGVVNVTAAYVATAPVLEIPGTGTISIYAEMQAGNRKGSVAAASMPAARLRAATRAAGNTAPSNADNVNDRALALGANRFFLVSTTAGNHLLLSTMRTDTQGNVYIRVGHTPA